MAWSISISSEGWALILEACHQQTKSFLIRAIKAHAIQNKIKGRSKWHLHNLAHETLSDYAYELIHDTNTCDNGGFKYWIDPKGFYKIAIPE